MVWTERQAAMLSEMGLHVPAARVQAVPAVVASRPIATAELDPQPAARIAPVAVAVSTPVVARSIDSKRSRANIAHLDWHGLRASAESCTACSLSAGRTRSVFGVGSQQAHWMVVGEAPGEQEDLRGEPFVGKPGQLLDNMLAAIGLSRGDSIGSAGNAGSAGGAGIAASAGTSEIGETPSPASRVYVSNAVKCRPPGNRNPTSDELSTCESYLIRQVELMGPKIILAMGPLAVQHLLQTDEPIGRLRGRVHRWQGVPLIVTYHPAYLLRNLVDKARAWDDLCLARETYEALVA